jgi:hypothetical protein
MMQLASSSALPEKTLLFGTGMQIYSTSFSSTCLNKFLSKVLAVRKGIDEVASIDSFVQVNYE